MKRGRYASAVPTAAPPAWARRRASWPKLGATLLDFHARFPAAERVAADPVQLAHGIAPRDAEVAALVASSLAFGNAKALIAKARLALAPLGPSLADACLEVAAQRRVPAHLETWVHRWVPGRDLAWLLAGIGATLHEHGSLRAAFTRDLRTDDDDLQAPMRALVAAIREGAARAGWGDARSRARTHLLPMPDGRAASKRLCLYLRWMARPSDGVDLGLWPEVPTSALTIPLDVHVARIGAYLGLTDRRTPGWAMARDITRNLARFDPGDPTRFDFALSHLGIMGGCPRRRDPRLCSRCDLVAACRL
jgi:uncharacterized protein (TIGR02757 family)